MSEHAEVKPDQKQHAKITPEVECILQEIKTIFVWRVNDEALQYLADALRDARLDELKHTSGVYANDYVVKRIAALERGEA